MLSLTLKDITNAKREIIPSLIFCLTGNLLFINTPVFIYIVIPQMLMYEYISKSSYYDYRYNSEVLFNSLPVNRREVVLSKYLGAALFFLLGVFLTVIFTVIFKSMKIPSSGIGSFIHINKLMNLSQFNIAMNWESTMLSCCLSAVLLIVVYLPIYFKVDYLIVGRVFGIISILISITPILILKLIGIRKTYLFINYLDRQPKLFIGSVVLIIVFLTLYLSIKLSIKFYNNKE